MTIESGKGVNPGAADNCYVHLDDNKRPVFMFGIIMRQSAAGRLQSAPVCISGFMTDGTPFAKGHIMAVELGGWDHSNNIVPQYENWQGLPGGAWRDMERAIEGNGLIKTMVVRMTYKPAADAYLGNIAKFKGGDTTFHWEDNRIPIRFEVWALTNDNPGSYFSLSGAEKISKAESIITSLGVANYKFDIDCMPEIDRRLWRTRFVRGFVHGEYDAYKQSFEQKIIEDAIADVMNAKGSKTGLGGPVGIVKPARAARTRGSIIVAKPKNLPQWVSEKKVSLAAKVLNHPAVLLQWLPVEKSSFNAEVLDKMVFS